MTFPHDVPEIEPPIGTVAEFHSALTTGGGMSTGLLVRTEKGWSRYANGNNAEQWAVLTDVSIKNAEYREDSPPFLSVHVDVLFQPAAVQTVSPFRSNLAESAAND